MNQSNQVTDDNRRFGLYLRRLRESRKLSLDAVEELASGYPDRITKSHLSRIENGLAEPTFRRMYALSRIYGTPVTTLAERFELDLKREDLPAELEKVDDGEILDRAHALTTSGRYEEALELIELLIDRAAESPNGNTIALEELTLHRVNCLVQIGHFDVARDEVESLLDQPDLSRRQRLLSLQYMSICCFRVGKFTVALLALEQAERAIGELQNPGRFVADLAMTKGNVLLAMNRGGDALEPFEVAVKAYDDLALPFDGCRARRNLATACLDNDLLDRADELLQAVMREAEFRGFERQKAYALSDLGVLAWKREQPDRARSFCQQSNAIARPQGYRSLVFRNCYYLWKVGKAEGDVGAIRSNERTLRSYASRVDETMRETREYLESLAGGAS